MPSSQAAHGRSSPTVMNSTTLLGTLPSEVNVIIVMLMVIVIGIDITITIVTTIDGETAQDSINESPIYSS